MPKGEMIAMSSRIASVEDDAVVYDSSDNDIPDEPLTTRTAATVHSGTALLSHRTTDGADPRAIVPDASSIVREKWGSKIEFLLAVVGFAVDLGNVWRFPYICYRNGGGAFLLPYCIMFVVGGLPLFFMELAMGQYHKTGCITIWTKICPLFKGIGLAICVVTSYMAWFYNTIIAYSVYFFINSFNADVPWKYCGNPWNSPNCTEYYLNNSLPKPTNGSTLPAQEFFLHNVLEVDKANGMDNLGTVRLELAACLFFVFLVVYFALWKGPRSAGKAVWITATVPYAVLLILLFRGLTLPGAMKGIKFYLMPQWDRLGDTQIWIDAATQIFFSLGPGFGVLLAFSSYNDFHNDCHHDAIWTSIINCLTSILSGFVIFSTLGYMALLLDKEVDEVAAEFGGPGLIFVVYPQAIATMKYSPVWAVIFFAMVFMLGIDSTFGGLEAMITAFCDQFPRALGRRRELFVLALVIYCYVGGLATTTNGGQYLIEFLDNYGVTFSLLFIVLVETLAICWCYGVKRFSDDVEKMLGHQPHWYWRLCWTYVSPTFIIIIFTFACLDLKPLRLDKYEYPIWSLKLGWCMRLSSILCIPGYALYKLAVTKGSLIQRVRRCMRPAGDDVTPVVSPEPC